MTAGWKLAAAVPEVQTTATGAREARARPRARNEAERSSTRTCTLIPPWATRASASGVERDPGATTASVRPQRASSSTRTRARAVDGFIKTLSFVKWVPIPVNPLGRPYASRPGVIWHSPGSVVLPGLPGRLGPLTPAGRVGLDGTQTVLVDGDRTDRQRPADGQQRVGGDVVGEYLHGRQPAGVRQLGQGGGQCDPGGDPDGGLHG